MLLYALILAAVLILAVALRILAEPDNPDNAITHHSDDDPPDTGTGDSPGDVLAAA